MALWIWGARYFRLFETLSSRLDLCTIGGWQKASFTSSPIQLSLQHEAEQVDTEALASVERFKKARKPPLNFLEVGVPLGSTLVFTEGEQTCIVSDPRRVEFEGEIYSMSRLAKRLTGLDRALRGSAYFTYNGRRLSDIYDEIYSNED